MARFFIVHAGMTLLEVLITLLILSIGLCAYLQATLLALHNTQSAYLRNIAQLQMIAFAEAMRACNTNQHVIQCRMQMQSRWKTQVLHALPQGKLDVEPHANQYQIKITWHVSRRDPSHREEESLQALIPI